MTCDAESTGLELLGVAMLVAASFIALLMSARCLLEAWRGKR